MTPPSISAASSAVLPFGNYLSGLAVIIVQVAYDAYTKTVGKDRTRLGKSVDILKFDIEITGRLKHIDTFQVIDTIY